MRPYRSVPRAIATNWGAGGPQSINGVLGIGWKDTRMTAIADRLSVSDATLTDLNRTLAMMGIAHWTNGGAGSRWRAVTQAQLGVRKGPIITPNIRAKVDRGHFRRGITLIGEFRRLFRDLILPAKAKWM
jgi:hypothetical protein